MLKIVFKGPMSVAPGQLALIVVFQSWEVGYRLGGRESDPGGCEGGSVLDSFAGILCRMFEETEEAKAMSFFLA